MKAAIWFFDCLCRGIGLSGEIQRRLTVEWRLR